MEGNVKPKPPGPKYRNLYARGPVIYVELVKDGERVRFSTESSNWDEAAAARDVYLQRKRERAGREAASTFGELAARYLKEATAHLSGTGRWPGTRSAARRCWSGGITRWKVRAVTSGRA
jgi:hypothetical protein